MRKRFASDIRSAISACRPLWAFLLVVLCSNCSVAYNRAAVKALGEVERGAYDKALAVYDKEVTGEKDKLLLLLDKGLINHMAGRYEESNRLLLAAERLSEQIDATSVSEEAATLLTNETIRVYQGEDFEKVLINVFLAMNYLMLGQLDEALVECRKVNHKLYQFVLNEKKPYKQNAFARYLSAIAQEARGDFNDAYVDYKKTLELMPDLPGLPLDLMRLARRLGIDDELAQWKKKWPQEVTDFERTRNSYRNLAEIVLLLEAGLAPQKHSSKEERQVQRRGGGLETVVFPVPVFERRPTRIRYATLLLNKVEVARTFVLNDIEETAILHLRERIGRMIAKQVATTAVKTGIAIGVAKATKSKELGLLAGILLMAMNETDIRSWLLLPETLQLARAFVSPGVYDIDVVFYSQEGVQVNTKEVFRGKQLDRGKPLFFVLRTFE